MDFAIPKKSIFFKIYKKSMFFLGYTKKTNLLFEIYQIMNLFLGLQKNIYSHSAVAALYWLLTVHPTLPLNKIYGHDRWIRTLAAVCALCHPPCKIIKSPHHHHISFIFLWWSVCQQVVNRPVLELDRLWLISSNISRRPLRDGGHMWIARWRVAKKCFNIIFRNRRLYPLMHAV